jgi:diaminopimelate epimerase
MHFSKYEGLGNDFVVLACDRPEDISAAQAIALCDRRRGIGADGVLQLLAPTSPGALARMRVINADGSVPEMCGNGLRCVALALTESGAPSSFTVDTDAGPRACAVEGSGNEGQISVSMGIVNVLGDRIVALDDGPHTFHIADAGNPHAITFEPRSRADMDRIGRALNAHPAFPKGTNVEFATLTDQGIDLVVFERGVGFTEACGTGACATVAVACALGKVPYDAAVVVHLPGGALVIDVSRAGVTHMRGPARRVYQGEFMLRAETHQRLGSWLRKL